MSTNPFYRFEQSNWNTGFEPAFTPTVDALYGFTTDIPSGFGVGASLGFALQLIQNFIDERNAAPYHFNFVLVPSYPIPLPPVGTGTQSWQYYITDLQLIAVNPAQKYVMDITTTDGIIDALTVTENTDTSYANTYTDSLFPTEIAAYQALQIAYQNGAAFFPSVYQFNTITKIASSSVARFKDCIYNINTGIPERATPNANPTAPYWSLTVSPMSIGEKYMQTLIDSIIVYGLDPAKTAININTFIVNLILPEGWLVLGSYDLTDYPRVQYTFFNNQNKEALGIVGRFDSVWKWQRFFNRWTSLTVGQLAIMEVMLPSTPLPYSPTVGKSYSNDLENVWYDFEQIIFESSCPVDNEFYQMPIKTADQLQFNVPAETGNFYGNPSVMVGLFDTDCNFIQQIGTAIIPEFGTQLQSSVVIPSLADGCYRLGLYFFDGETSEIYSISQPILLQNWDCFSNIIEFWVTSDAIGQGFEYINNWKQRIRVGLNGGGAKPRITEATYRQSNGVYKRPQNKQDLTLDLHTDFFDEPTQFAMTDATRHPFLVWNDKNIFVEGDIEVATVQDFTTQSSFEDLAQMKFSVLVQGFQPKNSSCL